MSQNTSLTLADAQGTPVIHTFPPIGTQNGIASYRDNDSSVTIGLRPVITASLRQGQLGQANRAKRVKRRVILKIAVPFQPATVDGVTPAVDTCECEIRLSLPVDAPAISIDDVVKYAGSLVYESPIAEMITEGEFPY